MYIQKGGLLDKLLYWTKLLNIGPDMCPNEIQRLHTKFSNMASHFTTDKLILDKWWKYKFYNKNIYLHNM